MRRRREIPVDLTALLDVILILIFILLTRARTQAVGALDEAQQARAETAQLQAQLAQAQEDADRWKRRIVSNDVVLEHSLVITISAESTAEGSGVIRVESEGVADAVIPYRWDDETYADNRLRTELAQRIADARRSAATDSGADQQTVFLVFQCSKQAIYNRQYALIERHLEDAKREAYQAKESLSVLETNLDAV